MYKQISAEYVLGSILAFKKDGISLLDLNRIENTFYKYENDYIIDMSRSTVLSAINSWDNYFKILNNKIVLSSFFVNNIDRVKYRFFDILDYRLRKTLITLINDINHEKE